MKPIIGLTTRCRHLSAKTGEVQSSDIACDIDYLNAVERAGGIPILLPRSGDESLLKEAVGICRGILLTGGGDVSSLLYGQEPHPAGYGQDPLRDEAELKIIRFAREAGKPILGICRGIQILNTAFGGTLHQDLSGFSDPSVQHWTKGARDYLGHTVQPSEGSLLADLMGASPFAVTSWHHQAVDIVGEGLKVNCRSSDGLIEGLESSNGEPILALQSHPEAAVNDHPEFLKIFEWLVKKAGE